MGSSKLTPKAERYKALKLSGKSTVDAYVLAGYEGNPKGAAPYMVERAMRTYALTDPALMRTGKKVAKHILELAEEYLAKARKEGSRDKAFETMCIRSALALIADQQDRVDPKKNLNINANVSANISTGFDFSTYKRKAT